MTITAKTTGSPYGGEADNPWPAGHPAEGERVAIFAFEVTSVDGESEDIRTYHVAPVDSATQGRVSSNHPDPQGLTVQWTGCGAGTVVRAPAGGHAEALSDDPDRADAIFDCEVKPDDMQLITVQQ
ncbi:hypothetical protein [Skermania sp. ID1734]|uniref:hypothetical protein n=1 Tax=Skermania sp. ID1734 TaxID=2597516 RepID=UPI002101DDE5|nr:hypothetical protein [Skermania sp. ID1734]